MKKTRHTTPRIIEKLRQADVALGKGQKVPDICKALEITEQTYYRWRQKYGGMAPEMAKQLKSPGHGLLGKWSMCWAAFSPFVVFPSTCGATRAPSSWLGR